MYLYGDYTKLFISVLHDFKHILTQFWSDQSSHCDSMET